MKGLKIALAFQVLFFTAWAAQLHTAHHGARVVWLETRPVDPRDYLSGHYVALALSIHERGNLPCTDLRPGAEFFIELVPTARAVRTDQGEVAIWRATACRPRPEPGEGVWARGTMDARQPWRPLKYGVERFYVNEGSSLRYAVMGDVVAKVSVSRSGSMRVLDLPRLVPPSPGP